MFCKQCGNEITDTSVLKCPKCNTAIGKGGRFCENCGSKIIKGIPCKCTIKEEEPKLKKNETKEETSKQENKPEILKNERVKNNPLFARIAAQEDNSEAEDTIYNEALKIAKRENIFPVIEESINKTEIKPEPEDKAQIKKETVEAEKISPIKPKRNENVIPANSNIPHVKPEQDGTLDKHQNPVGNEVKRPELPKLPPEPEKPVQSNPNPAIKQKDDSNNQKLNNLFPNTFNGVNQPLQPVPTIKREIKAKEKRKKNLDFCSNAANLILIFAFLIKNSSVLAFCLLALVSIILGTVDVAVNEKRSGAGAIIASLFTMAYVLIEKFLF